jgi:POT family proton-dependent oligopeptide transporter
MNIVVLVGLFATLLTCVPVALQLRRHPSGLTILFFVEMWERFSYYGMRGLLIFYLTQHFLFDDRVAQLQYGAYTSLVYLLPLVGGAVADRWLGSRKAIGLGAILLVAGHLALSFEGKPAAAFLEHGGQRYEFVASGRMESRSVCLQVAGGCHKVDFQPDGGLQIAGLPQASPLPAKIAPSAYTLTKDHGDPAMLNAFFLALCLIVMGVGLLKPSITSLVGQLYEREDPRRDGGFLLYYYGINMGSMWAGVLCGYMGATVGWWAGFGLASIGMAAGFLVFVFGKKALKGRGEPPNPAALQRRAYGPVTVEHLSYLAILPLGAVVWFMLQSYEAVGAFLAVGSLVALSFLGWVMATRCTPRQRVDLALALVLIAGAGVFWTLYEQLGSSVNQFGARHVALPDAGFVNVKAAQAHSFNGLFILLGAPVFAALWAFLDQRKLNPNPLLKFGIGLVQAALAFAILALATRFAGPTAHVPFIFLVLAYLTITTGELCIAPVGLSNVTRLSPETLISTVVAVWFLSNSWAHWFGGFLARLTSADTIAGQLTHPALSLIRYGEVFGAIAAYGAGAAGLFLVMGTVVAVRARRRRHGEAGEPAPSRA